jgi:hypothetical protein
MTSASAMKGVLHSRIRCALIIPRSLHCILIRAQPAVQQAQYGIAGRELSILSVNDASYSAPSFSFIAVCTDVLCVCNEAIGTGCGCQTHVCVGRTSVVS